MRELAVFYCPKCGHYAYYQTSRHPLCPKCGGSVPMCMLRMYYTEFMKMTCEERDNYLSKEMLKRNPSILQRVSASRKRFNSRETIAELCTVIMDLDAENKVLSDTVNWMHDTIWDMLRQQQASGSSRIPAYAEKDSVNIGGVSFLHYRMDYGDIMQQIYREEFGNDGKEHPAYEETYRYALDLYLRQVDDKLVTFYAMTSGKYYGKTAELLAPLRMLRQ